MSVRANTLYYLQNGQVPKILQFKEVPVITNEECAKRLRRVNPDLICTQPPGIRKNADRTCYL